VLLAHRHPVTIVTKGALILRDLDLLAALAERQLCSVAVSLTTLDDGLKRTLEPRAAAQGPGCMRSPGSSPRTCPSRCCSHR